MCSSILPPDFTHIYNSTPCICFWICIILGFHSQIPASDSIKNLWPSNRGLCSFTLSIMIAMSDVSSWLDSHSNTWKSASLDSRLPGAESKSFKSWGVGLMTRFSIWKFTLRGPTCSLMGTGTRNISVSTSSPHFLRTFIGVVSSGNCKIKLKVLFNRI